MKKNTTTAFTPTSSEKENHINTNEKNTGMNRRKFVELTAAAAAGFTIVPRHVLGGKNYIPPSDKVTLAYIGTGTEGIREMLPMLAVPEIQIVAVCDPNKEARGYRDWGPTYLSGAIKKTLNKPDWSPGGTSLTVIPVFSWKSLKVFTQLGSVTQFELKVTVAPLYLPANASANSAPTLL